eukprot:4853564-Amphidinium_carterae.1
MAAGHATSLASKPNSISTLSVFTLRSLHGPFLFCLSSLSEEAVSTKASIKGQHVQILMYAVDLVLRTCYLEVSRWFARTVLEDATANPAHEACHQAVPWRTPIPTTRHMGLS